MTSPTSPSRSLPQGINGLTTAEAQSLRDAGKGNDVNLKSSRSYLDICKENLFTFINFAFLFIGTVLIGLGRFGDSVLLIAVILGGVIVNVIQEIAAKRKLDEIALLSRPKATAIRDGKEIGIDPASIVQGDILLIEGGDQILVDGHIVGEGIVDVDESLLTGESDAISKETGDEVFSGTICISGRAYFKAEKVGKESLAYRLTESAREFKKFYTPLQLEINIVIRIFMGIACFLWALVAIAWFSNLMSLNDSVQRAAVIAGLVPSGLYLTITLSYALAAVRMVGKRVLVQQANAVESLSNVDVLCVDKTGTLTANRIHLQELIPIGENTQERRDELESILGAYAASVANGNATSDAIANAYSSATKAPVYEIPFSSARKWSALAFDSKFADSDLTGSFVLGAPSMIRPGLGPNHQLPPEILQRMETEARHGFRVLLFAYSPNVGEAPAQRNQAELPADLTPLAVLVFSDELRANVSETLHGFAQAGVTVKVISGDNPDTVRAIAARVGLGEDIQTISGAELDKLSEKDFLETVQTHTIFGRITPDQKAHIVRSLREQDNYVAMIGDGVNDVLSLKQSNLGIAMESGSKATRGAADIVLLGDSFETLPYTFLEGQRIRNAIRDVLKLFMVRVFCVTLLIVSTGQVLGTFPLINKHSAVVTLLAVGLPTFGFPLWAKPGQSREKSVLRSMLHFVVPATFTLTLVGLGVYLGYLVKNIWEAGASTSEMVILDWDLLSEPRTALVAILTMCGLMMVPFLKPPLKLWTGGENLSGDWRYTLLASGCFILFCLVLFVPPARDFFELATLSPGDFLLLVAIAIGWCFILRYLWRSQIFDRALGFQLKTPDHD
ncbi:MAG: HAD-IC family P-type ATPase [Cyanobacteria bacterium P01_D01_bin.73]